MYIDKIINLLTNYVNEYDEMKEQYKTCETNISLYNELIPLLKMDYNFLEDNKLFITIILSSLYSYEIEQDFYNALFSLKNNDTTPFFLLLGKINRDAKNNIDTKIKLAKQIKNIDSLVKSARTIIPFLKHKLPIQAKNYDIGNTKKIIAYYVGKGLVSPKEELLIANDLYYFNKIITKPSNLKESELGYDKVPNILNGGFEIFDEIDINPKKKETILEYLKEIKGFIKNVSDDELISSLEKYQYDLDNNEYYYIINEVIKYFVYDLLDYYNLLLDNSIYQDNKARDEVVKNYYELLNKYTIIRNYYHELKDIKELDIEPNEYFGNNILVFSHPSNKPNEARFINDLKSIPFEYYQEVMNLLNDFIKNNTSLKKLTNSKSLKSAFELKGDQIRIVLTPVKNNVYCILGVFAKKADNDRKTYESIFNRTSIDGKNIDALEKEIALGKVILEKLNELNIEKGRKGNR